ncbi:hypothetical protein BVH03_13930 [Pseudomonas sp. PA15(2017)]|uniref:hypothetical protein n=1 Tax=Pseudomonas sp. PA15(2017) TaxID=1932111 RepID=UPI0009600C3E|nr:hypothetical protein [Pseudomonas sp. PA15(2017)]OLU27317.1 hypothetical protein BVH03_13930 [Pseudomonas sp. PA15(2017)]
MFNRLTVSAVLAAAAIFAPLTASAQAASVNMLPEPIALQDGSFLLTIFLRHDQSKPLAEIKRELSEQDYFKRFPPQGIEVASWYVMMGIGQVVTLKVPAERLREVNLAIEQSAWGAYRTEFYPTYDYTLAARADLEAAAKK